MASIDIVNTVLMLGALLVIAGILSSLVATRFGAPLLLVFLAIGMLAGEDGPGGIAFSDYQSTYLVGSLALAVILFDGGLRTKLSSFGGVLVPSLLLSTIGVVLTAVLTAMLAALAFDLAPLQALLLGAIVSSTDAAAVFFLLRSGGLQLRRRVGATLEIESATNDPVAVFLTVVVTELAIAGNSEPSLDVLGSLAEQGIVGAALGVTGGLGLTWLLNRVELPPGLHPLLVVSGAVLVFGIASISGGSGFLAVYLAGLVVGNRPVRAFPAVISFHDAATWLCQIVMFLVLGLLVTPSTLVQYAVPALAVAAFLILVARPLAVYACLAPFRYEPREILFVAWVGLRGAVSIFLAAIPTLAGLPDAQGYFNVAFFVVLVSLLAQGWTITPLAKRLGMALPRTHRVVSRVELDLPGQVEQELVGYPILPDSPIAANVALPSWARPVLVVRGPEILNPRDAGRLLPGDYAYFLAPARRVIDLDYLFASLAEGPRRQSAAFGEFALNGEAKLGALSELYDLPVEPEDRERSVAELFSDRFEGRPEPGDQLELGNAVLVAREVGDEGVVRASIRLAELAEPTGPRIPVPVPAWPGRDRFRQVAWRALPFARRWLARPKDEAAGP